MTMDQILDPQSKQRVNLLLPTRLVEAARRHKLNLSELASRGIYEGLQSDDIAERWYQENKKAVDAYNKRIETEGLPVKSYWLEDMERRGEL